MSDLTQVELLWLEKRIENRIRFGHVAEETSSRPQQARPVICSRQRLCVRSLDVERFWNGRFPHRHLAGGRNRPTLLDRPLCQARRRKPVAPVRLAKGRARVAVDRCRRGARHRPCRRRARLLASRSQPPVGQRNSARLHTVTPSGLAPSAEGRTMTPGNQTLVVMIGAVALLAGAIVAKPPPIYIWNSSESVPLGLYRLHPASHRYVTELVAVQPPEPLATYPRPKWLFADRGSDAEARAGASRTDCLQDREHNHRRRHRDGPGAGARRSRPAAAGLGRMPRHR